jgi:Flp pilus assembly protein TadG
MGDGSDRTGIAGKARRRGLLFRFRRDGSGSVAIEFTMLAIPFSLLVFAILEIGISFAGQQLLANAADDIARQMRTGNIKTTDAADLRARVCARLEMMVTSGCPGLSVDLRHDDTSFASLANAGYRIANNSVVVTQNGSDDTFKVQLGASGSKNMLRVFYKWPVITDFMSRSLTSMTDGTVLQFATVTWQNEPY